MRRSLLAALCCVLVAAPTQSTPLVWTDITPASSPLLPRNQAPGIFDPLTGVFIVSGGYEYRYYTANDVWSLDRASGTWQEQPRFSPQRSGHVAIYDPVRRRMILYGGRDIYHNPWTGIDEVYYKNEVLALDLATPTAWVRLSDTYAPNRFGHSAIYDASRDAMIMFGGTETGRYFQSPQYFNTVYSFSLAQTPPVAFQLLAPSGTPPAGRYGHTAIYDPIGRRMVVFGGCGSDFSPGLLFNDVWELSLDGSLSWHAISTQGTPPSARFGHVAIYDPARRGMIVFGGAANVGMTNRLSDTWVLTLEGTPTWSQLLPGGGAPSPRFWPAAAYDDTRGEMIVFGGDGATTSLEDVWTLSLGVPPRPDLTVDHVEVAQAVVSPNLIRGKPTVVRVFLSNIGAQLTAPAPIQGRLHVLDAAGLELFTKNADSPVLWPMSNTFDETARQEGRNTLNFYLTTTEVSEPEHRYWVEIDTENAIVESDETNNSTQASPLSQSFRESARMRVAYCTISSSGEAAVRADMGAAADLVARTYPITFDTQRDWEYVRHLRWTPAGWYPKLLWVTEARALLVFELWQQNVLNRLFGQVPFDRMVGFFEDWRLPEVGGMTAANEKISLVDAAESNKQQAVAHELGHTYRLRGEYYDLLSGQWVSSDGPPLPIRDCPAGAFPCENYPPRNRNEGLVHGRFVADNAFDVVAKRPAGWATDLQPWTSRKAVWGCVTFGDPGNNVTEWVCEEDRRFDNSGNKRIGFMGDLKLGAGYAWVTNDVYELLVDRIYDSGTASVRSVHEARVANDSTQIWLLATITAGGEIIRPKWWVMRTGLPTELPDGSGFSVDLLGPGGTLLASYPFSPSFTEGDTTLVAMRVPFVSGTETVEVRRATSTMYTLPLSAHVPTVSLVELEPPLSGIVPITWVANDADGDSLRASLYYSWDNGANWMILASDLSAAPYMWNVDSAPGSSAGKLRVLLSDGVWTAEDFTDAPFVVAGKPPTLRILAPADLDTVVAGELVEFHATVFDPETGGALADEVSWSSDLAGNLGTGSVVQARLAAGLHRIVATCQDTDGFVSLDSILVVVGVDTDLDGMPDWWEVRYPGLNPAVADGEGDIEGDGLSNRDEYLYGTDPANPDSDGDGSSDGVEVAMQSDPRSASSTPTSVEHDRRGGGGSFLRLGPNPFRRSLEIAYAIPQECEVRVNIYDVRGREVWRRGRAIESPGLHWFMWSGRGVNNDSDLPSGVYFVRLRACGKDLTARLVKVR